MHHIVVYHESGKSCHGPANNGIWSWGAEIVVGFTKGTFQIDRGKPPLSDATKPQLNVQARSLDGGESWSYEEPANLGSGFTTKGTVEDSPPLPLPAAGIDFRHPDFAMRMIGPTFRISYDRCRSWHGPYALPDFGLDALTTRTAYLVDGPQACLVFLSGRSSSQFRVQCKLDDRAFCARTTDGGRSFEMLGYMVPEDPAPRSVQPSVVRLPSGTLVAGLRRRIDREPNGVLQRISWIDAYQSSDAGHTWAFLSTIGLTEESFLHNGNPPNLILLPDGRLAAVYGYRSVPFGIRLRISTDDGHSWGSVMLLRNDGRNYDLGYPRSVVRPDGKVVSVYWMSTETRFESHIAATIWDPAAIGS